MNRNQIKINNEVIKAYCKREHSMQGKVYPKLVASGKMTKYEANQNHLVITEVKEVIEVLMSKGIEWHELKKMVDDLPAQRIVKQQSLWGS